MKDYKSGSKSGSKAPGAGKGWGANGPGGPSHSKPTSKGPNTVGKATGTKG